MSGDANSDEVQYGKLYQELGKAKSEIATSNVRYGALSEELSKTKLDIATSDVGYGTLSQKLYKTKPEISASDEVRYGILSKEICKKKSEVATSDDVRYDILSEELSKNKAQCVSCSQALSTDERRNGIYRGKHAMQIEMWWMVVTLVITQTYRIIAQGLVAASGKLRKQVSVLCQFLFSHLYP